MENEIRRSYKGLPYVGLDNIGTLELDFSIIDFKSEGDLINSVSNFTELVGYECPSSIIINFIDLDIIRFNYIYDFLIDLIINQFFNYGVKSLYFIANERLSSVGDIVKGKVVFLDNRDEAINFIKDR